MKRGLSLIVLGALLAGCGSTLPQQRKVAALHHKALEACQADGARCKALLPCSAALSSALWAWQRAQRLLAGMPADPPGGLIPHDLPPAPVDPLLAQAGALRTEYDARTVCAQQGVK